MAAIINAIFGTYSAPEEQNTTETVAQQSANNNECLHTSAVAADVHVNSVISSETQAHASINTKLNVDTLLTHLSTTYAQVDQYSQTRSAEINEQAQKSIAAVLENTRRQQEELLIDANRRHLIIDSEHKIQLQKVIESLDVVKAKSLADLERDLHVKQQIILNEAKKEVDVLNDQASAAKLNVNWSTTTAVITSQAQTVETIVAAPVPQTTVVTNEQQVTTTTDNQLQVAIRNPTDLVLVPTMTNTTTVDIVPVKSDVTAASVELPVTSASVDVTSINNTIETTVKTS